MKRSVRFIAAVVLVLPSAAAARDYYYFNKPEVSRETYIADKLECDRLAGGVNPRQLGPVYVMQNPNLTAGQNALAVGLASLFAGLVAGGENRRVMLAVERTCMADKGYGRFKVEKSFVKQIDDLKNEDERIERYFALATTRDPVGTRIKE